MSNRIYIDEFEKKSKNEKVFKKYVEISDDYGHSATDFETLGENAFFENDLDLLESIFYLYKDCELDNDGMEVIDRVLEDEMSITINDELYVWNDIIPVLKKTGIYPCND